jgi:hypothetical protein
MTPVQRAQMWVHFNRPGLGGKPEPPDRLAVYSALADRPEPAPRGNVCDAPSCPPW